MTWIDLVDGVEAIRAAFGKMVPRLEAIRLHELNLHQDGPTVFLRFDLPEFPEPAPAKWQKAGHNTVQIRLALDDVFETKVLGWKTNNIGRLIVERRLPDGLLVEFVSSESNMRFVSKFVRIERLDAYRDASRVVMQ